jgi:hypothetical protein
VDRARREPNSSVDRARSEPNSSECYKNIVHSCAFDVTLRQKAQVWTRLSFVSCYLRLRAENEAFEDACFVLMKFHYYPTLNP